MLKGFSVSAVVVALLASTAAALPNLNLQGFEMEIGNGVMLVGDGSAANSNLLTLGVSQLGTDDVRHTTAFQGFNGAIMQSAGAVGSSVVAGALQNAWLEGDQVQNPNTGFQMQDIDSGLSQDVTKTGGMGSALALQTLVGIGTQLVFTPYGATANVQAVGDTVYSGIGGGPGSAVTIGGGSIIDLGQTSW